MNGHELTQVPLARQHGAEGIQVWQCTQCSYTTILHLYRSLDRTTLFVDARDAVRGDPAADHTGARQLVEEQARFGTPRVPRYTPFMAQVDALRDGF